MGIHDFCLFLVDHHDPLEIAYFKRVSFEGSGFYQNNKKILFIYFKKQVF